MERFSPRLVMGEGHLFAHAAFVLEGKVRIHKISESGREITLYRVTRGGVCVLMMASILGELEYAASAELEEETELLLLPVKVFRQWLDEYKDVRQFIYSTMIKRMASVTTLMENIASNSQRSSQPFPERVRIGRLDQVGQRANHQHRLDQSGKPPETFVAVMCASHKSQRSLSSTMDMNVKLPVTRG